MIDSGYIKVGENRYREDRGLYLEDFEPGVIIEHRPGRTVTATDNMWQTLLTMNQHPLHIDAEYAAQTPYGQIVVCGMVTISIVAGQTVNSISQHTTGSLGFDKIRLTAPVFVGDTLSSESEVLSRRDSKSRPNEGIVSVATRGYKQGGVQVVTFERTFLMPNRQYAAEKRLRER
jgi:itaconyl-CoA hydratase